MYSVLISLVSVAFVLGVMILIHEWGHYIAAKLCGVTVKVFSIGFGTRLIGFERNGTDYRISALPFGGYVKMAGDNPMEESSGDPGEFNSHPRWHRFIIAIAGPAMNLIFAFVVLTLLFHFHYPQPLNAGKPLTVGYVDPHSPAEAAGLQAGDVIVAVQGNGHPTWQQVQEQLALNPNQPVQFAIERGGVQKHITVTPKVEQPNQTGSIDFDVSEPMVITQIDPSFPAANAGMKLGDTVVAVNGQPVYSIEGFRKHVQASAGHPLAVTVRRDGKDLNLLVAPKSTTDASGTHYAIGIYSDPIKWVKLPLGEAITRSVQSNTENAKLILVLVKKMAERKVSMKAMSGPIGIAQMSGEVARMPGWSPLLEFMCLISINLGVMNLFPIPILDGGVILLLLIEAVMRRDISLNLKERIYQASFVFLVLFAAIVVFNDVVKLHG